jgi:predicted RNA-binding Zn ribbon-like protein
MSAPLVSEWNDRFLVCAPCGLWWLLRRTRGGSRLRCTKCGKRAKVISGTQWSEMLVTEV